MTHEKTWNSEAPAADLTAESNDTALRLVLAWSVAEPHRVGEIAILGRPGTTWLVGRGDDGDPRRLAWVRQRPTGFERRRPLADPHLSRVQVEVEVKDEEWLTIRRRGQRAVSVDGEPLIGEERRHVTAGALVQVGDRLLMAIERAGPLVPHVQVPPNARLHPFGEPDANGMVGESALAWTLRDRVRRFAPRDRHALVRGETGVGKELVARALHAGSRRADGPFVARNSATFPAGLIDAELFGNVRNYPNPGMPERPGLLGEADGGTLFLDELGELPEALQAHLLRALDAGEYQRLGEARDRRSDFRLVAATNRSVAELKYDLATRLAIQLEVPPLRERWTDIPILLRYLAKRLTRGDEELARAVLDERGEPRIACNLVASLLLDPLDGNVRQIEQAFWHAVGSTPPGEPLQSVALAPEDPPEARRPRRHPIDVTREELVATLRAHGWKKEPAWRALGLKDRYQLRRLMKRHGVSARGPE